MRASDSVICRIVSRVAVNVGFTVAGTVPGPELQRVEQNPDRRQRLTDVVVELARDALALALDRREQLRRQALPRRLGRLPLGDVARDPEQVDLAVGLEAGRAHLGEEARAVLAPGPRLDARHRSVGGRLDVGGEGFRGEVGADVAHR